MTTARNSVDRHPPPSLRPLLGSDDGGRGEVARPVFHKTPRWINKTPDLVFVLAVEYLSAGAGGCRALHSQPVLTAVPLDGRTAHVSQLTFFFSGAPDT